MAFRDDRDAVRARAQALEVDLAETRAELESLRGERERAEVLRAELAKKERELAKLRGEAEPPSAGRRRVILLVAVAVAALGLGYAAYVVQADREIRAAQARRMAELAARERRPPPGEGMLGRVVAVTGERWAIAVGDPCRVDLSTPAPHPTNTGFKRLAVFCGDVGVYDSRVLCAPERAPTRCQDERGSTIDGSPRMDFDATAGTLRIEDGPRHAWSLDVRLQ